VPISAAGRELSALLPAMASGISTLQLELAPGRTVDLPGTLHSSIGISGNAQFNYRLPAGSSAVAGHSATWEGADLKLTSSPDGRRLSADMRFDQWALTMGEGSLSFANATLRSSAEMTGWGFAIGDFELVASDGRIVPASGNDTGFAKLTINMTSALEDERMRGSLNADVAGLRVADKDSTVRLRSSVAELDALHLGAFLRRLNDLAETAGDPGALGITDLEFEARRLLSAGATINLQELRISNGPDDFLASIELTLPRNDEAQAWVSLLLALQGNAEFEIPAALIEANAELATQLQALIAAGFLIQKDGIFRMSAAYAKGLATINGVPMPVPMPGM
jgi:Bacterial protein of unknown function (DUF945)